MGKFGLLDGFTNHRNTEVAKDAGRDGDRKTEPKNKALSSIN